MSVNKSFRMTKESEMQWFELEKGLFGSDTRFTLGEKFSASRKCKDYRPDAMDVVGEKHLLKKCKCYGV